MREFAKISTSIWRSKKFGSLQSDDAKLLYFYLHTCPHVNMVGCFVLPIGYAMTDLGWTEARFRDGLDTLSSASLTGWDEGENLIRIVDFIKHSPFANPSHAAGAVKAALDLPECGEKDLLIIELARDKHVSMRAELSEKLDRLDTVSGPSRHIETETEPETDAEAGDGEGERDGDREKVGGGESPEIVFSDDELKSLTARILDAMGANPKTGKTTPNGRRLGGAEERVTVARWLRDGVTPDEIVSVIEECTATAQSPPNSINYFSRAIDRLIDAKNSPKPPRTQKATRHAKPSAASRDRLGPILGAALARSKPI